MIKISHDYGYVYDLLAISQIKRDKNPNNLKASENFNFLSKEIEDQVGEELHFKILKSKEYNLVYLVNEQIYMKLEELKTFGEKPGDAIFVDSKNYERWVVKCDLQKVWFAKEVKEQKFGYKNE